MTVQLLDAIRAAIEPLEQRLEVLRQMEALARQLDGDQDNGGGGGGASTDGRSGESGRAGARASRRPTGASPAPARPATARRSSPAGGELGAKTQAVLDVLRAREDWMSVSQITEGLGDGTTPDALRARMKVLVDRTLVEARGATSSRRYRAASPAPKPPSMRSPERVRVDVQAKRDEVLAAVGEHGPATFARLIELTDFGRGQLLGRLQELAKSSLIVKNLDDTWQTTASKDAEIAARNGLSGADGKARAGAVAHLRGRVAQAIAADRDALTEQRLAVALGADREDIALACGLLLDNGDVAMNPDGTYRTTSLGGGPTTGTDGGVTPTADGALAA